MWYALITIAVLVVSGLAFYAGQLLWKVKAQEEAQKQEKSKKLTYITESVSHIAKAMHAKQCEYSEGVLRIWVLLDHYNAAQTAPKDYKALYPGFANLYEVVKDMPTHEARKKFSKKEIFEMDTKRWDAEKEFEQQIETDLEVLLKEF
ncbi:DUF2489 domain-containing protein [Psychrosphaera aestuarii]|uniref:DUF2489 domain-containing protein n=1 Tax=Psychrosphaera aestuarii TaxID=1266052 RepID=UPI001B32A2F5|nr:DUF2489 domain-containing protein [Psychrosphaera aestuarii]